MPGPGVGYGTGMDTLPLPDYDDLPVGAIESRAKALDAAGVRQLLDYERSHADRPQVIQVLEHRLEMLESGAATPSGGSPDAIAPEAGSPTSHGSPASPDSQGPPQNAPAHGDPTNPAQPPTGPNY